MADLQDAQPDGDRRPDSSGSWTYLDLRESKAHKFWLLNLGSLVAFLLWLPVVSSIAGEQLHLPTPSWALPRMHRRVQSPFNNTLSTTVLHPQNNEAVLSSRMKACVDIWFAISLPAGIDAAVVVFTFNRPLMRRFHFAVSVRLMLLACVISCVPFLADSILLSSWPVAAAAAAATFAGYRVFERSLDALEDKLYKEPALCWRGTLQKYIAVLGRAETSWVRAAAHTAVVTAVGLGLTAIVRAPWSPLVPLAHILFESAFLFMVKSDRTARYLVLCSPVFFAAICVHWGLTGVLASSTLSISPGTFVALALLSRGLLDVHLHTSLRKHTAMVWARKEVLPSTNNMLTGFMAAYLFESVGMPVISYAKPITVIVFFGLASVSLLSVASHNVVRRADREHNSTLLVEK